MSWVLFEVVLALGLAIFIVWWTFPNEKKRRADVAQREADPGSGKDDTNG